MLYIDPGAGTLLVQTLIASAIGAAVFFRQKLGSWVGRWRRRSSSEDDK